MFKNLKIMTGVIAVALTAYLCSDQRKTQHEALQEAVSTFKLRDAQRTKISIYPKEQSVVETDTLWANGFRAKIKTYSNDDPKDMIVLGIDKPTSTSRLHRRFTSDIIIAFNKRPVLDISLNAKTFANSEQIDFWHEATLQHSWVDQEESTNEYMAINVLFTNPKTEALKLYKMIVYASGDKEIYLIEENNS